MSNRRPLQYPRFQAWDDDETFLDGGTVTFFEAGSTNKRDIFQDAALSVKAPNPVTLNSRGEPEANDGTPIDIYIDENPIKIVLKDSDGVTIHTIDNYIYNGSDTTPQFVALDLGDDGNDESSGLDRISTVNDTNNIATESVDDELNFDMGQNWPAADIADALSTGALDDVTEIDGTLRTGVDTTLVTGTAGTNGNFAMWNSDGDLVDSGNSDSDYADASHTHTLSDITDSGDAASKGVTGLDANAVTGTAGTAGNVPQWNADGDIVDSGQSAYTDERVDDRVNDLLTAGSGISLSYDDGANSLTITNTDSGSGDDTFSGVEATRDTTLSVSNNSATIINWDGEIFDTDDYHESVTNPSRLTVPTAGKYLIGGTIEFAAWSALSDGRLQVRLFKNGSFIRELIDNEVDSSGGDGPSYSFQTIVDAAASDYFELNVLQASGGSRDLTTNSVFYAARMQGSGPSQLSDLSDVSSDAPADGEVLTWNNSISMWEPQSSAGGGAFPLEPEHATDSGTDTYDSASDTTPPGDGVIIVRDFQSSNTTTTPTLDGKTITDRDGNSLWASAISGVHSLQYDSGTDTYMVLYPNKRDVRAVGVLARHQNLAIQNNSISPSSQVDIDADELEVYDSDGVARVLTSVDLTVDIANSGANGLDTGSEASSKWYHLWVIYDGTTVSGLISLASSFGSLALPSGYNFSGYVGAIYNDGSSNFISIKQKDAGVISSESTDLSSGTAASFTGVGVSVPSTARFVFGGTSGGSNSGAEGSYYLSATSGTDGSILYRGPSGALFGGQFRLLLDMPQTIYYRAVDAENGVSILTTGWEF